MGSLSDFNLFGLDQPRAKAAAVIAYLVSARVGLTAPNDIWIQSKDKWCVYTIAFKLSCDFYNIKKPIGDKYMPGQWHIGDNLILLQLDYVI